MIEDIKKDADTRMDKSVEALRQTFKKMRTGRAHTGLLEHIMVDYYGTKTPLNQVANLAVEDARTLTVTPWEQPMISVVEKAIMNSDLGLTPTSAGAVIRVPLPALTEERRRDLAKLVKHDTENGRIAVRNIRRDSIHDLKDLLKEKEISEDVERRAEQDIQSLTDSHIAKLDEISEEKQKEIMEF
ncbi:MAG: ribosome recycling factor [Gammaproteobacteria bacterium]|nr:ribosome recycling factor [Chromatiales bacterium]MDP6675271.1 ribosome recycling factor [Gammaproteobacteria bacterium]